MTRTLCVYGLTEQQLRQRLDDMLTASEIAVALSVCEGHGNVTVTAEEESLVEEVCAEIQLRLSGRVYSNEGKSLATAVVELLSTHNLTVATAESCTGGMIAAAITDVPGASRVFGTGVVSYSNQCKATLLSVSLDTLSAIGAVSAETAGQMARGVRQTGSATLGVAVTGEAGPVPAENLPVGTVFIALADGKRTWVEELHLDGPDRASIRRQSADRVLWLLWRYLSAYPAVMAGGESNRTAQQRIIPLTQGSGQPRLLSKLLPWRGDSRRRLAVKWTAILLALAVLIGSGIGGYQYLSQPHRNLELQESLGDLYWNESTDLTDNTADDDAYPTGMLPVFRGLYDMNADVGGWLHIPGTGMDYPVMNHTDGYYDNHSFLKEYSIYGQPYFGSPVTQRLCLVYGQNTGDGQMFSELLNYRRVAYVQEHSVIECNTVYQNSRWQIVAVAVLDDRNPNEFSLVVENMDDDAVYAEYLSEVQERSLFLSDVSLTTRDRVLVLTTTAQQEYGFPGARLAVFARLVEGDVPTLTYRVNNLAKMPSAMYGNADGTTTRTLRGTTTTVATETQAESTQSTTVTQSTTQTTVTTESSVAIPTDTTTGIVEQTGTTGGTATSDQTTTTTTVISTTDTEADDSASSTTVTETGIPTESISTDPVESTSTEESISTTETTLPSQGTTTPTEEAGLVE